MYQELAIIAPTASGKTALSIKIAHKIDAVILSLDSLSVYKEIDIASAKPTLKERDGIKHFGIDCIYPNEKFDVVEFIDEYKKAKKYAIDNNKNLIIVGGTGFYLKSMIEGLSVAPILETSIKDTVKEQMQYSHKVYELLYKIDPLFMNNISKNDSYRIEKALEIYLSTNLSPSEYFSKNKPKPIVNDLSIFEIQTDTDILRDRIALRTKQMVKNGIIDEVINLENNYTRKPNAMSSIGIVETLDYLDGKLNKKELEEQIFIHTAQLAKRQRTFNRSQFKSVIKDKLENLEQIILKSIFE